MTARRLRLAGASDTPRMAAIYREDLQRTYRGIVADDWLDGLRIADAMTTWRRFLRKTGHQCLLCVDESGRVLGFAGWYPNKMDRSRLEFASLYVAEESQGRGVGGLLIRAVLAHAQARGYRTVAIRAVSDNVRAVAIYRHYGAQPVSTSTYRFGPTPVQCTDLEWKIGG
ncbi:GNAT family N-acetyltransferase [Bifidobacterium sp. 82T10]|uniref:GNAT family N-acetyltransferase n=1 Tax=Bifidobacterium miconis TaxID=2834435 RepID=A0ABS6WDD9_9BIFI|nr:GNAT family N-acetyltransferase [Bifidobacterium miconis]MBW3092048.1 GNAT family N-acetyltransferase [Bifidobacterium miconis]